MKKDARYIGILSGVVILFLAIEIFGPKPVDWTISLSPRDKNPFGSYLIHERLPDLFDRIESSNSTIYELQDSLQHTPFILTRDLNMDSIDAMALFHFVHNGGNAFISSSFYSGFLSDTLNVEVTDYLFEDILANLERNDSTGFNFKTQPDATYPYRIRDAFTYFDEYNEDSTTVLAVNDEDQPVFIRVKSGKGAFYLSSTPLAFTNNYFLYENNYSYVSKVLSHLPQEGLHWTEYYYLGRIEPSTPLRYVLSETALKWGWYILLTGLMLFLLFQSKRTQRIIPLITPPKNSTLEFVATLGNLYYRKSNHKNIIEKRIAYFYQRLNEKFFFHHKQNEEAFVTEVAQKTGHSEEETEALFNQIEMIRAAQNVSEEMLIDMNKRLDRYNF